APLVEGSGSEGMVGVLPPVRLPTVAATLLRTGASAVAVVLGPAFLAGAAAGAAVVCEGPPVVGRAPPTAGATVEMTGSVPSAGTGSGIRLLRSVSVPVTSVMTPVSGVISPVSEPVGFCGSVTMSLSAAVRFPKISVRLTERIWPAWPRPVVPGVPLVVVPEVTGAVVPSPAPLSVEEEGAVIGATPLRRGPAAAAKVATAPPGASLVTLVTVLEAPPAAALPAAGATDAAWTAAAWAAAASGTSVLVEVRGEPEAGETVK